MGRTGDNFKGKKMGYKMTNSQLKKWGLKFINSFYLNQVLMYMWMIKILI